MSPTSATTCNAILGTNLSSDNCLANIKRCTSQFFLDRIDINGCTSEFFLNRTHVGSQLYLMGFLDLISKFGLVSFGFSLSPDFNSKYSKYTQDQRVRGIYLFRSAKSEISERWCNSVIGKDRLEMGCSTGKKK